MSFWHSLILNCFGEFKLFRAIDSNDIKNVSGIDQNRQVVSGDYVL
ncbi:hypothetical protein [Paracholeplasma brassicae]|nr:hypothetical protein [Paracholeplasma brassicae]